MLKNKIIYSSVLVVCFVTIVGSIFVYNKNVKEQSKVAIPTQNKIFTKTDYKDVLPPGFPSDAAEKGAKITQSYLNDYNGKTQQSSVVLLSENTVKENFSFYENYLNKNKWKILSSKVDDSKSTLFATKDKDYFEVILRLSRATSSLSGVSTGKSYIIVNFYKN